MPIFGPQFRTADVSAEAHATHRSVYVMLVLDRSYSMQYDGVCSPMIQSAQSFVNGFTDGNYSFGLITFMGSAHLDFPFNTTFRSPLSSLIGGLKCNGSTGTAEALWLAHQQLNSIPDPTALKVLVLYTDGAPDSISADFSIKDPLTCKVNSGVGPQMLHGLISSFSMGSTGTPLGVLTANDGTTQGLPLNQVGIQYYGDSPIASASGCSFQTVVTQMPSDVASIPATDFHGNLTTGNWSNGSFSPSKVSDIQNAALNAADNAAQSIRNDKIVIYAIGESPQVNDLFLKRVANDPQSPSYKSTQPTGSYVYASTGAQLVSAFSTIAAQIQTVRLTN
jgi:hypothetical protein